jgi:hypothetical protein
LRSSGLGGAINPKDTLVRYARPLAIFKSNLALALSSQRMENQDSWLLNSAVKEGTDFLKLHFTAKELLHSLSRDKKIGI